MSLLPIRHKKSSSGEESGIGSGNDDTIPENEKEEKVFNPSGFESHLVETLEKEILQKNPNIQWNDVAGLTEAKAILQEAMVLPTIMPDFFKVYSYINCLKHRYIAFGIFKVYIKYIIILGHQTSVERCTNGWSTWYWQNNAG